MSTVKMPFRQSPLAHRDAISASDIKLCERPYEVKIIVRAPDRGLARVLKASLGIKEFKSSHSLYAKKVAVHWLGPDTVMVVAQATEEERLLDALEDELGDEPGQVVKVSDFYTVIEVAGARSRDVLQKLSTLDLHEDVFVAGQVAGTLFAHSQVILACRTDKYETFDVIVRRSHADYLWCLLANAGYEYGLPKQLPLVGEVLRA